MGTSKFRPITKQKRLSSCNLSRQQSMFRKPFSRGQRNKGRAKTDRQTDRQTYSHIILCAEKETARKTKTIQKRERERERERGERKRERKKD